jgi:hydrogenase nickel incorporation protein HypA/HybF
MHELSIAQAIVDVAERHAPADCTVAVVRVRVGRLRQVVPTALAFAFELCAHGTRVDGAELVLEEIAVLGRCRTCSAEAELAGFPLACPACAGLDVEVVQGEELLVDELEFEQDLARSGG